MSTLMLFMTSPLAIVSGVLFFGAYLFYRWLLPKPIAGIPYNKKATKSIFGDIPVMLDHLKHNKCITDWFELQVWSTMPSIIDILISLRINCTTLQSVSSSSNYFKGQWSLSMTSKKHKIS